ncbi:nitrilase-related carbon-nitrogen hydrolase [Streptomyces sp. NRRL F-5123]|uniref:nitrilase-related carbon-nitrogen hydrolase n=1 Tax=Streptomyces sp. NRRL F-5123 TaxID=1463856 RepID=UPI000AD0EB73|nr:nitrilase-related carbon-nitrogen hydrolase [Streptomyces sp. NRRL F-5123]
MRTSTVALLQLAPAGPDLEGGLTVGEAACRRARAVGADIAVFPEVRSNSYASAVVEESRGGLYRHPQRWDGAALPPVPMPEAVWLGESVDRDSPFVRHFQALAELDMATALTYPERWDGPPRNSVSLIDRHGRTVLHQAKVHTCAFGLPEALLTPGTPSAGANWTPPRARCASAR